MTPPAYHLRSLLFAVVLSGAGCLGGAATTTGTGSVVVPPGSGSGSSGSGGAGGTSGGTGSSSGSGSCSAPDRTTDVQCGMTVGALHFAVLGDCRPASETDNVADVAAAYPTPVIAKLFSQVAARQPQLAVFTGDMVYAYNAPDSAGAQMDLFLQARNQLDKPLVAAMGNHDQFRGVPGVWYQKVYPQPYYSFVVHTSAGDALFVVIQDTYWDTSRESPWAASVLAQPAAYHIVIKHHPTDNTDVDQTDLNNLLAANPPTLVLSGHEHHYAHRKPREAVIGLGGAPLRSGASFFGYLMVDQLSDGSLQVTAYDTDTDAQFAQFSVGP